MIKDYKNKEYTEEDEKKYQETEIIIDKFEREFTDYYDMLTFYRMIEWYDRKGPKATLKQLEATFDLSHLNLKEG